jgi:hypothetical protein
MHGKHISSTQKREGVPNPSAIFLSQSFVAFHNLTVPLVLRKFKHYWAVVAPHNIGMDF